MYTPCQGPPEFSPLRPGLFRDHDFSILKKQQYYFLYKVVSEESPILGVVFPWRNLLLH